MTDNLIIKDQSADEMRAKILALEAVMFEMKDRQVELPVKHYHIPGVYIRELPIPAGVTLTGLIHKTEHYCILSKGAVSVYTEDGMKFLTAGAIVHSMPGMKRVLYAHEDSIWVNVHSNPDNIQDPEIIEQFYTVKTFEELQLSQSQVKEIE
jgi:hypothetical protein